MTRSTYPFRQVEGGGRTTVLAEGKYVELSLSRDHRYLAAAHQGYYLRFRTQSGREVYDAPRFELRLFDQRSASWRSHHGQWMSAKRFIGSHEARRDIG